MSLRDIVSHADLTLYPKVALFLFLLAFLLVVVAVIRGDSAWERAAQLPLEGDAPVEENQ